MNIDGREIILMSAIALTGLLLGTIFGFFLGAWGGSITGYENGVEAGINYSVCVVEETPLYGTVTDKVIDDCWETYIYEG